MIDLHLHTTYSDGVSEAENIIQEALDYGLEAIAITDHDNTESYAIACRMAKDSDMEVIPGIEINTVWTEHDQEVHVLGYYINPEDKGLRQVIEKHRTNRIKQIKEIVKRLNDNGLHISYESVAERSCEHGTLGRPHVAQVILEAGGGRNISDIFDTYLNKKSPTYLRRETASPHEAVEAIYDSGGIPVIAHPNDMEHIDQLIVELMDYGLRGLEAYHKSHSPAMIEFHCSLAEKYGLIVTGGTDFHGASEGYQRALDRLHIPDFVIKELRAEHNRRNKAAFKVS